MSLNERQTEALQLAVAGHNLVISGSAGTGKSFLLREIEKVLSTLGKRVQILCTTGISCLNFTNAQTVHKWAGLYDGRYSTSDLKSKIRHSPEFELVHRNVTKTDIIIIDEVSMLSKNIFDQLACVCSIKDSSAVFGGIQVVVCGDFIQLPPVPNTLYSDSGDMCFHSVIFKTSITHKIELTDVIRQSDAAFINVIRQVSIGEMSQETDNFVKNLDRPVVGDTTKLFANNHLVDVFNRKELMKAPGQLKTFKAKDSFLEPHKVQLSRLNVQPTIWLKKGSPVILLRNLTPKLVNGLRGTVIEYNDESVTVHFPHVGITTDIKAVPFTVFNPDKNRIVATRHQIPLKLAYALTIHKSQGMTMDRVVIDCQQIFKPGQLGVALGRVRSADDVRVINFSRSVCLHHPPDIVEFLEADSSEVEEDLTCCRYTQRNHQEQDVLVGTEEDLDNIFDTLPEQIHHADLDENEFDDDFDNFISEIDFWERSAQESLPDDFIIEDIISKVRFENPITNIQEECNAALQHLERSKLIEFCQKVFYSHRELIEILNITEPIAVKPDVLTEFYKKATEFQSSDNYKLACKTLFSNSNFDKARSHICFQFTTSIRTYLLSEKAAQYPIGQIKLNQRSVTEASKGVIRYVGGYCVQKSRKAYIRAQNSYMYSLKNQIEFDDMSEKVNVMNSLREDEYTLKEFSEFRNTLDHTIRKQNINKGLFHISDNLFEFFKEVDQECTKQLNNENLQKCNETLHANVKTKMLSNTNLQKHFHEVFKHTKQLKTIYEDTSDVPESITTPIFEDLVTTYLQVKYEQFRKDVKESFAVGKKMEHRKQIQVSKKKKDIASVKNISFASVQKDESENKSSSHTLFRGLIDIKVNVFNSMKRDEIIKLLRAYDVKFSRTIKKKDAVELLTETVSNTDGFKKAEILNYPDQLPGPSRETVDTQDTPVRVDTVAFGDDIVSGDGDGDDIDADDDEDALCKVCQRKGKAIQWIKCDKCMQWLHRNCAGLRSKRKWDQYTDEAMPFFCTQCLHENTQ